MIMIAQDGAETDDAATETFAAVVQDLFESVRETQGPQAAAVLLEITHAMLTHHSDRGRGITPRTWDRWARMIIQDEADAQEMPAWYTVLHRLQANAHWTVGSWRQAA